MKRFMILAAGMFALAALPARAADSVQQVASLGGSPDEAGFAERFTATEAPLDAWTLQIITNHTVFGYWKLHNAEPGSKAWIVHAPPVVRERVAHAGLGQNPKAHGVRRMRQFAAMRPALVRRGSGFADGVGNHLKDELIGRGLTQFFDARGFGYFAGPAACSLQTFAGWFAEDGDKWSVSDTLNNIPLSAKNCILPIDDLTNAKSAPEFILVLANAVLPYAFPAYGAVPGPLRQMVIDGISKPFAPQASAAAAHGHPRIHAKIKRSRKKIAAQ